MQTKCAHHHLQHSVMSYSILKQTNHLKVTVYALTLANAKPKYEKLGGTVKPKLWIRHILNAVPS